MHVQRLARPRAGMGRMLVIATAITAAVGIFSSASPAHADSKVAESVRYESTGQLITNWKTFAADGTPTAADPTCPQYPGVHRWSKVYADAYIGFSGVKAEFRMQFHSTYSAEVAEAKAAIEQTQNREPSCSELYNWDLGTGMVAALKTIACAPNAIGRPARWCQLASLPTLPPSVDMTMNGTCRQPAFGGKWGLTMSDAWNDVHALFYKESAPSGLINVPVYLDDFSFTSGVDNWNTATDQPSWGDQWVGYGRVQSPYWSELNANWYDNAAKKLGLNPFTSPLTAHRAVQAKINNNAYIAGIGYAGNVYKNFKMRACNDDTRSPKIKDLLNGYVASLAGFGQDISAWVKSETGKTLCQNLHGDPKISFDAAKAGCNPIFIALTVPMIDNNDCLNQQTTVHLGVTYPPSPIAQGFGVNLGCTRNSHLIAFFTKLKEILGG
jgi:hypothetical protein